MKPYLRMMPAAAAAVMLLSSAAQTGTASAAENKPHETSETLGAVGSVSKMFVTLAAMQLADQGRLEIDAHVTDYLPEFKMADSRYGGITVRMLMNHESGLMGSRYGGDMLLGDRSTAMHDSFLQHLSQQRLKAAPGAYGSYCNDGFMLLELVVERVSGEDFTDYMERHICAPLGLQQTGTPWNAFETPEQVRVFNGKTEFTPDYCMGIGEGGVLSTAPELSQFGTAFFTGNTVLLSDSAKDAMRTRQTDDPYEDGFGLGWDTVSDADYAASGVQVVSKGGDLGFQHAELLVAPDCKISVAVLSSGADSSADTQLSKALMDIALGEQGITVTHEKPVHMETVSSIPEQDMQYAGLWQDGTGIRQISFPGGKYMRVDNLTDPSTEPSIFLYTTAGVYVEVKGNPESGNAAQPADSQTTVSFTEKNGESYLLYRTVSGDGTVGYSASDTAYMLQRVAENPVSDAVQAAWAARSGKRYYLISGGYSDMFYCEQQVRRLVIAEGVRGYVNELAITDETHAQSRLHIPSTASRDQSDIEIRTENGQELLCNTVQDGIFLAEDCIPELPADLTQVHLTTGSAAWYNISSSADRTVTLEIPERAAVYVYDRHDRVIASSFMKDYGSTYPLPQGGKIVFVGETGSEIKILSGLTTG